MGKIGQLSVGAQVTIIFGLIGSILVAIGLLLFFSLRDIEQKNKRLESQIKQEWMLNNELGHNLRDEQNQVFQHLQTQDGEAKKNHEKLITSLTEANASKWDDYRKLVDNETEKRLYSNAMEAQSNYSAQTETLLALSRANRDVEARDVALSTQTPTYNAYQDSIDAIGDWTANEAAQMAGDSTSLINETIRISDPLIVAGILVSLVAAFGLVSITRRLKDDNLALEKEVAERKRAEQTLHESDTKFKQLAENIDDVFWLTTPDMKTMLYVSPAYEKTWGHSVESLYADPRQWGASLSQEEQERVTALIGQLWTGLSSVSTEMQIVRPDRKMRWIHSRVFPVRDTQGDIIRLTGIATDITERKLIDEQLERLRKEHATILNSVSEGVQWIGTDGNIKFENSAAAQLLGFEMSELLGRPAHATMHHTRADGTPYPVSECPIYATLHDGVIHHVKDEVFWRKDGSSFPVDYTSTPVRDERGEPAGTVVVFTDVTDRKRIEARLFQSQKMETVGKLAGGVAHEFNSILTAIIGQSELLLSDLSPDDPGINAAREIRMAADRAASLTRQLLAYGRKQILQPEILDLDRVLTNMVGALQHLMGREVDVRLIRTTGLRQVKIDPGQIEQVIVSIAMNAADAMPNGGRLTIETSDVTLDEDYVRPFPGLKPGAYVMMAIADTGVGMTDDVKSRAFEPFFSTKGVGEGTGLGLATCYGIIKQSEGHISVYSELARGTTFKIYLPQVVSRTKPMPLFKPREMPMGTETILLAEDDPALLEMSSTLLKRLGYTVLTATNGMEALALKQQRGIGHIDLLLTDVVMPHMNGKELADRIRVIYPGTKILFTSAYTENTIAHQGILTDGISLLSKPFTPSALSRRVREVLDQ